MLHLVTGGGRSLGIGFLPMSSRLQIRTAPVCTYVGRGEGRFTFSQESVPRFVVPLRSDAYEVKVWVLGVNCTLGSPQRSQSSLQTA